MLEMRALEQIVKEIKERGLTAYEISKAIPVTEGGILKILNGKSKRPQKSTLHALDNYLNELNGSNKGPEENAVYLTGNNVMMLPVVGQRAQAGFLVGYGDNEYLDSLPHIPYEVDKEYRGKYVCFEVSGDSMDNGTHESILENDVLVCREVQRHHWINKLHINKWDFVLVHKEHGIVVKRITKHDTDRGILTLHSLNEMYEDYTVRIDDLIAIFNVVDVNRSRRR